MVLIWAPLVQESHTPHTSYVLDPLPMLKMVWIQEGSLWGGFYALRASIWGLFDALAVVGEFWAPFTNMESSFLASQVVPK